MARLLMIYLLLSSLLFCSSGCTAIKQLKVMDTFTNCPPIYEQRITTVTYNTQIDFAKKHFSGLLVFKALDDTTKRVVFITETGFKFFDFEFTPNRFRMVYILPNLNKKIIVTTFQKDLSYLLLPINSKQARVELSDAMQTILKFPKKGNRADYYYADKKCYSLQKIESGTDKKKSLSISVEGFTNENFETVKITHHGFPLSISLKQVEKEDK